MRFFILFLLINLRLSAQIKMTGFSSETLSQVESALRLIKEKDEFRWSRLNEFCREIKWSADGKSRTEGDSVIVIPQTVISTESVNYLACTIIHESKRLELRIKKYGYSIKKEEFTCASYEYGFSCKIDSEDWLKQQIQDLMIEWR